MDLSMDVRSKISEKKNDIAGFLWHFLCSYSTVLCLQYKLFLYIRMISKVT